MKLSGKEDFLDEAVPVYRPADCLCPAAGRAGDPVAEVTRKMGVSEQTFYRWKKKFGGLMPSEVRKLRQLEEENARLRRLVADLSLDKEMLQEVIRKKL
jgi:putative transposase